MGTGSTVGGKSVGRSSSELIGSLRSDIASGAYAVGSFLPSVRQLAGDHKIAPETARRALKALESEGLVIALPGSGYQVTSRANNPRAGCPLAFLDWRSGQEGTVRDFNDQLLAELKAAADSRGWSLLTLSIANMAPAVVAERLKSVRAFGAALSIPDRGVADALTGLGLPVVVLDDAGDGLGTDSIMQDGHQGGVLAARHLIAAGCRRVAWFGPDDCNAHTLARFGGFAAGLFCEKRSVEPQLTFSVPPEETQAAARRILSGPDRPDGVAALWQGHAAALQRAAGELGLVAGRDFQMIGWCPEEHYRDGYESLFAGGPVPPAVTWSIRTMAFTAAARMAERRENPSLPALSVKVPVRLLGTEALRH